MEKITKEELLEKLRLSDDELEKISGSIEIDTCISNCYPISNGEFEPCINKCIEQYVR